MLPVSFEDELILIKHNLNSQNMSTTILPKDFPQYDESIYAGFGRRIGAFLLDFLIIVILSFGLAFLQGISQSMGVLSLAIQVVLFGFMYTLFFVKQYGATPGKFAAGIKIVKLDGTDVGWTEAIMRSIVDLIFMFYGVTIGYLAMMSMTPEEYDSLTWMTRGLRMQEWNPTLFQIQSFVPLAYGLSEFIVLWTNKRRRDFRDLIGETLQIKESYQKEVLEIMEKTDEETK